MEDEPFLFPLVVPHGRDILTEACNKATPRALAAWELNSGNAGSSGVVSIAMGCDDGSVFIFHPEETISTGSELSPTDQGPSSKIQGSASQKITPFSNLSHLYRAPSPAPSTSSSSYLKATGNSKHASFQPSKSRVQAGISNEQAEAPKNYVDFDDEPAKLKQMLKPRENTKERGFMEGLLPSLNIAITGHTRQASSEAPPQLLEVPQKGLSNPAPPSKTSTSTSASTSPPTSPSKSNMQRTISHEGIKRTSNTLKLTAHAFPPRFGYGRGITALQPIENGAALATLQECGYASH